MRVYLVQHGEAKPKDVDPDRRLTEQGVRDVEKTAGFLKPLGLRVRAVWHSGKRRAAQTAGVLESALEAEEGVVQRDGLAPNDPVAPVAGALSEATEGLMIVGHMPFMAALASTLLLGDDSGRPVAFQQGGVVCLQREQAAWHVAWMIAPARVT